MWSFSETFDGNTNRLSPNETVRKVRLLSISSPPPEGSDHGGVVDTLSDEPMEWKEHLREILLSMEPSAFERR